MKPLSGRISTATTKRSSQLLLPVRTAQFGFRHRVEDSTKILHRIGQLDPQQRTLRIEYPVVMRLHLLESGLAQTKRFPQQALHAIALDGAARDAPGSGDAKPMMPEFVAPKKNRHEAAIETPAFFIDRAKLRRLTQFRATNRHTVVATQ